MGQLQLWVRSCIENCRSSGRINTQNKGEVLLEEFAGHLDKVLSGGNASETLFDVALSSDELAELNSTIQALQLLKKANTSVVAFLPDLHMAEWSAEKIKKAVYGFNRISESVKTDLLLLGGDYLDNSSATTKEMALAWYSDLRDILSYRNDKAPAAVLKGNHDDNTMYTDYANGLVDFETFWAALGNLDEDRTIRNAGNIEDCYGYYDIPNQKIRVFYVNTIDIPQEYIEVTNSVTYRGQWDTGISVKQLQFIADNLKFDTPGWHVMVFSHHPIMRDIAIENGCGVQADRGGAALLELLDKFNTGNTTGSISVTATDFEGTVSYDFTSNVDCKMVACINGHTHRDSVEIYNESFFCISTRGVYGHPSYDGHISSSAYFVVDRNNEKLHLMYNGDGEENVFDYGSLNAGEEEPDEPVEPDDSVIELGKPLQNVLYLIGASASIGTAGMDVYENAPRMTALAKSGEKPIADVNSLYPGDAYFIAVPAEAVKITVTCPEFIPGLQFLKYENDAYTKLADPGWQTINGCESSFTAGTYTHVAINYKNSSNTTIPTDTDTSGFSIVFE